MCDLVRIDALWVRDQLSSADGASRLEAWTALTLAGLDAPRVRVGAVLNVAYRPAAVVAAMARTLDAALGGRLELGFSAGRLEREQRAVGSDLADGPTGSRRVGEYVVEVRRLTAGAPAGRTGARAGQAGTTAGERGREGPTISVEASGAPLLEIAARVADNVVIPASPLIDISASVAQARRSCEAAGRDPATLGIAVELPVSIGRTSAEAQARADAEPLFREVGHPSKVGIFGTLEQCQDRVIELAHAGVTDLHCILPNTDDVHDVIAQLTAAAVGSTAVLTPDAPRSRAPDPPVGWGGRPRPR